MPDSNILKFKAKRGYFLAAIGFHVSLLSSIPLFLIDADYEHAFVLKYIMSQVLVFTLVFIIGVYLRTYYVLNLDKKQLTVYFFFKVKTVNLDQLKGFEKMDSPMSGGRYALSSNDGILIKEGKYDSFFINPEDQTAFIEALQSQVDFT